MATMIQTKAFLPYVLPKALGVSVLQAEFQIRLAAIEFCERTRIWRHMVDQVITANDPLIVCPDYAAVHAIERAQFAITSNPLAVPVVYDVLLPLAAVPFVDLPPAWRSDPEAPPECVTQITPNQIILYPFHPGRITMSVFLKPRDGSDYTRSAQPMTDYFNQVPDFLAQQHAESIAAGALSRILALPKRPYTDPDMAGFYLQKFNAACDAGFSTSIKGQQRAPRRSRYNDF